MSTGAEVQDGLMDALAAVGLTMLGAIVRLAQQWVNDHSGERSNKSDSTSER